jgi:hypothetical protein
VKNQQAISVSIPTPCHENWDLMSPHEQGKYCMVCSKAVIDFTQMTDTEIIRAIQKSSQTICGRLDEQQLDSLRPKYQLPKKMKVFLYALAVAFLIELPTEVFAQIPSDTISSNILQSGEIYGRVMDEKAQPLDFATVQILVKDKIINGAKTDINGNFRVKNLGPGNYVLKIIYLGYFSVIHQNIIIDDSKPRLNLNFLLKKNQHYNKEKDIIRVGTIRFLDPSEPNKKVMYKNDLKHVTR